MSLNDLMYFDHVVRVHEDGSITDEPNICAPELYNGQVEDPWELMDGYSGQYGYPGPIMHSSEFISGRMERDIRENPGLYVALISYSDTDPDEGIDGWAVAYQVV